MTATAPEQPTIEDYQIGISNLPNQRFKIQYKRGATFTIMLAGESGLGKTTFINTLLSMPFKTYKDNTARHGVPLQKTVEIEITKALIEEKDFVTRVNVIDTPGFGDNVNNKHAWKPVVDFIDDQLASYMAQEEQPNRLDKVDMRVHACLYFIRPTGHSLKPLDIEALRALSARVNVIPIVAKADTLSFDEMKSFKERVRDVLRAQNIKIFKPPQPDENDRTVAVISDDSYPLSVIGSESEITRADGTSGKGRVYPWGTVEVENEEHCDFKKLHRLLIRDNLLDLIMSTEEVHYENFRAQQLENRANGKPTRSSRSFEDAKFLEEETALRNSLTLLVKQEEARFKRQEAQLIAQRDQLNKDLAQAHSEVRQLEIEYDALVLKMKR